MDEEKILSDLTILFLFCINTGKRVKSSYEAHLLFTYFKIIINPTRVRENALKEKFIEIETQNNDDASYGRYSLSNIGIDLIKSTDLNLVIDRLSLNFPLDRENILSFLNT